MLKTLLIMAFLSMQYLHAQKGNFSIKAKIQNKIAVKKAYIQYSYEGKLIIDSVNIKNKKFSFRGETDGYSLAKIYFDYSGKGFNDKNNKYDYKSIYLENQKIKLTVIDSLVTSKVLGGKLNDDYTIYKNLSDSLAQKITNIRRAAYSDANLRSKITSLIENAEKENLIAYETYIRKNKNSYFSLDALNILIQYNYDISVVDTLFNDISEQLKNTKTAQQLKNNISLNKLTPIGKLAPIFIQNDVNGKQISLADYRGKFVLVDFWASWCVPCRFENPNLVKAYNMFKNKGFDIIGISLDNLKQKDAWIKAIEEDGLLWTQVSDFKGWNNEAATLYGVRSIPSSYLIDPEGKIISKNLRGRKLIDKLEEIFK